MFCFLGYVVQSGEEDRDTTKSEEKYVFPSVIMPVLTVTVSGVVAAVIAIAVSKFSSKAQTKEV